MKSCWETFKGKRLFYAHYEHLTLSELRVEMDAAEKETLKQPRDSVLLLVGTAGTIVTPVVLNLFKNVALRTKPYIHKTAVLGISGARKTMLDIVVAFSGMQVVAFEDEQKARNWLVQA
jgi:hypothetical protein